MAPRIQRPWRVEAEGQRTWKLQAAEAVEAARQRAMRLHREGQLTTDPLRLDVYAAATGRLASRWSARLSADGAEVLVERWSEVAQLDIEDWLGGAEP